MTAVALMLMVLATTPAVDPTTSDLPPAAEVVSGAGLLMSGHGPLGRISAHTWLAAGADGRVRLGLGPSTSLRLRVDAGLYGEEPLRQLGPARGAVGVLRLGMEWGPWAATAGIYGRVDDTLSPLQMFPSLNASWRTGDWSVVLGLLDRPLGPLARVAVEHRYFGVGYTALAGVEAWGRLPIGQGFSLELRGFGERYLGAVRAAGSLGLVWQSGGGVL